ncbi:NAD(P)-binding protein [Suillus decipiens]|nr:NAD(P)-binding protein [Suillus decipiens]
MFDSLNTTLALGALPLGLFLFRYLQPAPRRTQIPPTQERVLILGSTSGVGRTLAHQYAKRGARLCLVGRRESMLHEAAEECRKLYKGGHVLCVRGDCASVEDMAKVRDAVIKEWDGIDTLIITAGVSALQPLMTVAGVTASKDGSLSPPHATAEATNYAVGVAKAAIDGNFFGPYVAAITFIPLLTSCSISPSILLLSSLAAVIPAPTRALYASTKSASLMLFQALAIEHPHISFMSFLPSTIEGDFHISTVNTPPNSSPIIHEADPNKYGLQHEVVATCCIQAIDCKEKIVFMPKYM